MHARCFICVFLAFVRQDDTTYIYTLACIASYTCIPAAVVYGIEYDSTACDAAHA